MVENRIQQPEQPFVMPEFPQDQLTSADSSVNGESFDASVSTDDRATQSIFDDGDDQLSEMTEARTQRKR